MEGVSDDEHLGSTHTTLTSATYDSSESSEEEDLCWRSIHAFPNARVGQPPRPTCGVRALTNKAVEINDIRTSQLLSQNDYDALTPCNKGCEGHLISLGKCSDDGYVALPPSFHAWNVIESKNSTVTRHNRNVATTGDYDESAINDYGPELIREASGNSGSYYRGVISCNDTNSLRVILGALTPEDHAKSDPDYCDMPCIYLPEKMYKDTTVLWFGTGNGSGDPVGNTVPEYTKLNKIKYVHVCRHPMVSDSCYMPAVLKKRVSADHLLETSGRRVNLSRSGAVISASIMSALNADCDGDSIVIRVPFSSGEESQIENTIKSHFFSMNVDKRMESKWRANALKMFNDGNADAQIDFVVDSSELMAASTVSALQLCTMANEENGMNFYTDTFGMKINKWALISDFIKNGFSTKDFVGKLRKSLCDMVKSGLGIGKAHTLVKGAVWVFQHHMTYEGSAVFPLCIKGLEMVPRFVTPKFTCGGCPSISTAYKCLHKVEQNELDRRKGKGEATGSLMGKVVANEGIAFYMMKNGDVEYSDRFDSGVACHQGIVASNDPNCKCFSKFSRTAIALSCDVMNSIDDTNMNPDELAFFQGIFYTFIVLNKENHVEDEMAFFTSFKGCRMSDRLVTDCLTDMVFNCKRFLTHYNDDEVDSSESDDENGDHEGSEGEAVYQDSRFVKSTANTLLFALTTGQTREYPNCNPRA